MTKGSRSRAISDAIFELRATADTSGMANLRINCMVSIPTGIRILAMIEAEEGTDQPKVPPTLVHAGTPEDPRR
jgi:hypothetical protein